MTHVITDTVLTWLAVAVGLLCISTQKEIFYPRIRLVFLYLLEKRPSLVNAYNKDDLEVMSV